MATAEEAKSEKMRQKASEVRRTFNLPESEFVVQGMVFPAPAGDRLAYLSGIDYHCSLWRSIAYVHGHMWITPNYLCFSAPLPSVTVSRFRPTGPQALSSFCAGSSAVP
jgi:hypothetical protein